MSLNTLYPSRTDFGTRILTFSREHCMVGARAEIGVDIWASNVGPLLRVVLSPKQEPGLD